MCGEEDTMTAVKNCADGIKLAATVGGEVSLWIKGFGDPHVTRSWLRRAILVWLCVRAAGVAWSRDATSLFGLELMIL